MWSPDGASLFYVGSGADGKTAIFRIGADGAGKKQIPGSEGFAESIRGLTPDGAGLVWSRGQAGGSVEVLDMATGVNRHLAVGEQRSNAVLARAPAARPSRGRWLLRGTTGRRARAL
jgi:Tol biopolymer transport system component